MLYHLILALKLTLLKHGWGRGGERKQNHALISICTLRLKFSLTNHRDGQSLASNIRNISQNYCYADIITIMKTTCSIIFITYNITSQFLHYQLGLIGFCYNDYLHKGQGEDYFPWVSFQRNSTFIYATFEENHENFE